LVLSPGGEATSSCSCGRSSSGLALLIYT
jgi:hypothetical protein